jgi:CheY-like chemotaxis protein
VIFEYSRENVPLEGKMSPRILVVDDNETNLDLVGRILQMEGYEVITAENGAAALQKVDRMKVDLAVLDMMMPSMDGFELCRRLRQLPACVDIPVIMLTASYGNEEKLQAEEAGANALLGKPFDMDILRTQIKALLG